MTSELKSFTLAMGGLLKRKGRCRAVRTEVRNFEEGETYAKISSWGYHRITERNVENLVKRGGEEGALSVLLGNLTGIQRPNASP